MSPKSSTSKDQNIDAPDVDAESEKSIYVDYKVWKNRKRAPDWHPVKKMRYVFFRMIDGITITDALREIKWNASDAQSNSRVVASLTV
jgi:hypothetical protein